MIPALPLFHRVAGQPVIVLGEGNAAEAKRRLVERAGGIVITEWQLGVDQGARLAFVAHDNPAAIEADVIRLRCAGLLVNAVDRPELCDFTLPSLLDRSPVLVAIGTAGASAGLAKALRLRLEGLLPGTLGRLAEGLAAARQAMRQRWPDAAARRLALDAALTMGGPLDPLDDDAADRVTDWLAGTAPETAGPSITRTVTEIRLRGPDPDDLTLRELRLLGSADVIAHEAGIPAAILDRGRADAARRIIQRGEAIDISEGIVVILRN